jgi:diaminopimelate epimerase
MLIDFTKMHGLGNDFMVVDNLAGDITFNAEQISNLANRHFGIGFDQLLVVETSNRKDTDFRYVIYNADGSEAEQCGNGARCFARFVSEKGLSNNNPIVVETRSGIISLHLNDDNTVRVDMGKPNLKYDMDNIMPTQEKPKEEYQILREKHQGIVLSVGNPHYVMIKKDIWNIDVEGIAEEIQNSGFFPDGINVGFMQIGDDRSRIQLRVYERGVGETLTCGSGACAAVIYGTIMPSLNSKVRVDFEQGDVQVEYKKGEHVFLSGPAQFVFEGRVEI